MNLIPLLQLLSDGQYHSGEDVGKVLGVSRAAIWKQIRSAKDLGVEIEAVTGRGYRIPGGFDLLEREKIASLFDGRAVDLRSSLELSFSTGSTNSDAMSLAQQGVERALVMAEHQVSGRGRRGRSWVSPLGYNLYMSLLWSFQGGIAALEGLSLVCALAVRRTLAGYGCSHIQLKWPNDVLLQGRKLAGILLEVTGDVSGPCRVVIGLGLNVKMSSEAAGQIDQPFGEFASYLPQGVSRSELAAALVNNLVKVIDVFERDGFVPFREEWLAADAYLGKRVAIISGALKTFGTEAGVDLSGRLLLETESGRVTIAGGELTPSLRLEN